MKETSKAQRRRCAETSEGKFDWDKIFKGDTLDVGSGDDALPGAAPFDLSDGGGDQLTDFFPDKKWDCIHGSNVLEHAIDPVVMLRSWIACLKPRGYVVASVPDWVRYEHCVWPSKWNAGHRSIWSMDPFTPEIEAVLRQVSPPWLCKLPEWLNQFLNTAMPMTILLCRLVTTNYDFSLGPEIDQTFDADKNVECFIEFCLKRA